MLRQLLGRRLPVVVTRGTTQSSRLYSQTAALPSAHTQPNLKKKKVKYDRSVLKPILLILAFGSLLSAVSDKEREYNELERRYQLKIKILEELIERVESGDTDFRIDEELKHVNRLFLNSNKSVFLNDVKRLREEEKAAPGKGFVNTVVNEKEETLDDVLKSIMDEINDATVEGGDKSNYLSREHEVNTNEEIIKNKYRLEKLKEKEKKILEYIPETKTHIMTENVGDFTDAAKDNDIPKFL
ncbi:Ina22p NDAI_0G04450 [Naumovozyma dairenensis CBS 421]|uniref:Inner membrane assembly complex subunit 22 n=1 Tax=Naumovozyma dairenensis (strain ATCC 10597 / BCRC 20456 / CBS 421 / NBRC 0211 / NRRL Y-12639) TaxID=1071378 RepID=J7SBN4_NAUDC|nr:hypothetical protein NDAI_0G04450 [Naumovozyma dairenensis CBS 421]CCK73430.1 hypothetical protein NDAI_0G04450 [Naumovozyma dairenensis CBS 421]